ncbi:hypothetical protein C9374_004123 [Naegleria lovaniensis]|uniref:Uncharacterized protein n=1 Tax=Naegleria lovaniensis TaxID=51637 RepID=A0AA88GSC1_NAELO|nr:uncharacterized protein C9374_004123 [Naegleria lovaniensis]KAG2383452.1 hypothetical protein C9374_004123 [Naegleria lovaniensis]
MSKAKDTGDLEDRYKRLAQSNARKDQLCKEQKTKLTLTEEENKKMIAVVCTLKQKSKELIQEMQRIETEGKNRIAELEQTIQDLRAENEKKDEDISQLRRELKEVTKGSQNELTSKDTLINNLEKEITSVREQKDHEIMLLIKRIEQQKQAIMEYIEKEKSRDVTTTINNNSSVDTDNSCDRSCPLPFLSASEYEDIMSTLRKPSLHLLKQQIL